MTSGDDLRQTRLVFYAEDIEKVDKFLKEFLRLSGARCALLIDKEGHHVTKQGETACYDTDTISALVAASFAATKEMARLLGEDEFSLLFHQGKRENIQLTLVGDRTILAVIFDEQKTTIGMVRLYAQQSAAHLIEIFRKAKSRPQPEHKIDKKFTDGAKGKLDELFGS